ncbi:3-ketosteroid 9alpha-monooxygenase subunit B [Lentzea xinjiangensis]|uniref:3-ketosteroid 9alpha-monooxygenase subunit B n=1 Tax=Lentzea xinjiangensis TaxID=402600 RepID=A0A1H9VPP6_9PSEU|nr:ferredoxin--NADP reductase [Lentzea xinjiangensis]SES23549.1 3-ketosteroid 9alpha-monooxygenase subunit B [Lentzea xinjiangensis]
MAEVHRVRVEAVIEETADARSFVLSGADFTPRPGQFLTVRAGEVARCYSLSSAPGEPLKITVKRTPDGWGSLWMCSQVRVGTELDVLAPAGVFTPSSLDGSVLAFAAGSGITPIMSIVRAVLGQGAGRVFLFYANRDESSVIFARELDELARSHPRRLTVVHWLESVQGLPHLDGLRAFVRSCDEAFVCGPAPFMEAARQALHDVPVVHVEKFVSLSSDPFTEVPAVTGDRPDAVVEVELDGERHRFPWPARTKLLDLLLEKGLDAPYSCREGACSACACRLVDGEVKMLGNDVLDSEDIADGIVLACQSVPVTDTVRITYD